MVRRLAPVVASLVAAVDARSDQRGPEGGGGGNRGGGGGGNNGNGNSRYNMELFVSADNVLNNVNYGGYSGSMLSPYFLQPTSAQAARRVQMGMGFRF